MKIIKTLALVVITVVMFLYIFIGAALQESYKLYPLTAEEIAQREGK